MKYRLLLLLAALIWGFAFVAQVIGMDSIGPYAFNGIRFLLGSLSLLPIIYYYPSGRNPKEASFSIWVAILMAAPEPYLRCHPCHGGGLLYFHHRNTRYRLWRLLSTSLCRLLRGPYHSPQLSDAAFPACHPLIRTIHGRRYMQPYSGLLL